MRKGKPLATFAPGTLVYSVEYIGDEVRETFYIRDPDRVCRYSYDVPVASLGTVQGDRVGIDDARFVRLVSPCRDPGEADGRVLVHDFADGLSVWGRYLKLRGVI